MNEHRIRGFSHCRIGQALRAAIAVICCAAMACTAPSLPPPDFEGDWDPLALLNRSVESYGGREAVLDFNDLSFHCEMEVRVSDAWIQGKTSFYFLRPGRLLSSLALETGDEKIVLSDGRQKSEWVNGRLTGRDVEGDIRKRLRLTRIHAFFMEEDAATVKLSYSRDDGEKACALLTRKADGEVWSVWVDLAEFLIQRIRLHLPLGDADNGLPGPVTIDWRYDSFEWIAGRRVPQAFKVYQNGELFQKGRVVRFSLNEGIPEEAFRPDVDQARF